MAKIELTPQAKFRLACLTLKKKVEASLKTQGILVVQASIDYFKKNEIVSLPVKGLTTAETIEIYEQALIDYKNKLVGKALKKKGYIYK